LLFAEYQHAWWQDTNFNTPAASPFFNHSSPDRTTL
jgi:hypothetical protein